MAAIDEVKNVVIEKIKELRGIEDATQDTLLDFSAISAINAILNYCHLEEDEFPYRLIEVAVNMSLDLLNEGGLLADSSTGDDVKSIKEGDMQITRATAIEKITARKANPAFIRLYSNQLNSFRKLA
ncbi:hypothetical protein [Bavariicoccus seileri]|uniref:hypothetical protein n=1 Tax=Bavariicoccus seileri TaxID=549685 RepID=UPI0003B6E437|nr:hypothetical protein [Bavariicoccus seileri]